LVGYRFGVGREAPAFTLTGYDGTEVSLGTYRGEWFAVLVFLGSDRAAGATLLAAMNAVADRAWGMRAQLIALAPLPRAELGELVNGVPVVAFPLLADEGARVARAYGAFNRARDAASQAAYIVDRAGKIVWAGEGPEDLKPASLIAALQDTAR
jgi:peroxiredoxin